MTKLEKYELDAICKLTDDLTARKLEKIEHLCIENFASELLGKLISAYIAGLKSNAVVTPVCLDYCLKRTNVTPSDRIKTEKITITPEERKSALETLREKHPVAVKPKVKRTYNPDVTTGKIYPKIMKALSGRGVGNVGISPIDIARMTGLDKRQVGNAIYKLNKAGKIKTVTRGMWVKA